MPKSEKQKLKILYIAKFFLENSDENHSVVANDICDYLESECEITAERRSVYRDIALLRDVFGMDIEGTRGGKYRLLSRQFEFDDLRLLAECVHAAKFISAPKAKELVETICEFCSIYQADDLRTDTFLCDRVKTTQKGTLNIISTINGAMTTRRDGKPHEPHKITFKYLKYSIDDVHSQVERKKGETYKVSPYKLLINEGNYYLLAFDDKSQQMRTYRIDRMKNVNETYEPRDGADEYYSIDMTSFTRRTFNMFGGNKKRVTISFINSLLDTAIERFGTSGDVYYMPTGKHRFNVTADVEISPQFFGWICGFGKSAKIISPQEVVDKMEKYVEDIYKLYKS